MARQTAGMPLPNLVRAAYLAHNQRRAEEARCSRGIARADHAYRLPRERIATADGSLRVTDSGWDVAQLAARFPEPGRMTDGARQSARGAEALVRILVAAGLIGLWLTRHLYGHIAVGCFAIAKLSEGVVTPAIGRAARSASAAVPVAASRGVDEGIRP